MMTITITPATPVVGDSASVAVDPGAGHSEWPITVKVKDLTVNPPAIVRDRSFSSTPIRLPFTPTNAGSHEVCVLWGTDSSQEEPFTVDAAASA